ncbi:MAG: hypothetical protein WCT46_03990 [Candidatus Gracilibacteria bacterium]|jgi:uncharacterized protein YoxC
MKTKIIAIAFLIVFAFSGCKAQDKLTSTFDTVTKETTEAYENVKTEVETKTDAVEDKINAINQAAEDIGEATDAVGDAIDSVQAINDTGTGTTEE